MLVPMHVMGLAMRSATRSLNISSQWSGHVRLVFSMGMILGVKNTLKNAIVCLFRTSISSDHCQYCIVT